MPKAFMTLNTKEDFEKLWREAYNCGYQSGIHDGRVDAIGRAIFVINEEFDDKIMNEAEHNQRTIGIRKWNQRVKRDKGVKLLGVREYIESNKQSE